MTTKKSTKKASKRGASKRVIDLDNAGEDDGFSSGAVNDNIAEEETPRVGGRKRAEQIDLIADRKIPELDRAARAHVGIRDERMALTAREVDSKARLKGLMKKHEKETYTCDGVEIRVVHIDEEDIKVKVAKGDEGD